MVWTDITRPQYRRKGLRYSSDTTDDEWRLISPHLPPPRRLGRPRSTDLRAVVNALFYIASSGCQCRLLPDSYPPFTTVQRFFYAWRDDGIWQRINHTLVLASREVAGREASPSAGVIDSQSVKTTEVGGERGYDAGKKVSGRKRHAVVDTLGLLMAVTVTAASADDGATAPRPLGQLDRARFPRLEVVFADQKYKNRELDEWLVAHRKRFRVEVVRRPEGQRGFVLLPKRWVSERSFAWSGRDRRHSKDYEYLTESSESWVRVSAIGQMLRRLAPDESRATIPFKYQREKAA